MKEKDFDKGLRQLAFSHAEKPLGQIGEIVTAWEGYWKHPHKVMIYKVVLTLSPSEVHAHDEMTNLLKITRMKSRTWAWSIATTHYVLIKMEIQKKNMGLHLRILQPKMEGIGQRDIRILTNTVYLLPWKKYL
jgi:hypothetical protein